MILDRIFENEFLHFGDLRWRIFYLAYFIRFYYPCSKGKEVDSYSVNFCEHCTFNALKYHTLLPANYTISASIYFVSVVHQTAPLAVVGDI